MERRKVCACLSHVLQQRDTACLVSKHRLVVQTQIWLRAEVCDGPDGTLFAEAKALFVNAREGTVSFDHMTAFPTAESCTPGSQ